MHTHMHFVVLYCTCSRYATKEVEFSDPCTDVLLEHVNSEKLLCRTLFRDFSFNDHRGTVWYGLLAYSPTFDVKCVEQRLCTRVLKLLLQSNKSHSIVIARFDTSFADWLPSYLLLLYPRSIVYFRAHPIDGRGPLSVRKRQFISHHCFSHHRTFVFFVAARWTKYYFWRLCLCFETV